MHRAFVLFFSANLLLLTICLSIVAFEPAPQQKNNSTTTAAETLATKDFLKLPKDLDTKKFLVAKVPPKVDVAFFGSLDKSKKGTLWSSWGDGCLAENGKYYTSIGDHLGIDGQSYIYEYDPARKVLRRVVDVLRDIMHMLGLYGHGKIHSGIHQGADGWLYFTTYWGKHREIETALAKGYEGSILLRYHPKTGEVQNLGAIVPKQGLPASIFDAKRGLLYFHAVYEGNIAVYDINKQKRIFLGGADKTGGNRTFLLGQDGEVFFSTEQGTLHYYDPQANSLKTTTAQLPESANKKKGNSLRASARASRTGLLYGMTAAGQLFSFNPKKEKVKDLGPNFLDGDYTAVMALSPDEKYLYFAPGAHGSGNRVGTPVVQFEIATGKRKVLAFLRDPLFDRFQYKIGGTYSLQISDDGGTLYFTFNGAQESERGTFGTPSVVVVHIPSSERQ